MRASGAFRFARIGGKAKFDALAAVGRDLIERFERDGEARGRHRQRVQFGRDALFAQPESPRCARACSAAASPAIAASSAVEFAFDRGQPFVAADVLLERRRETVARGEHRRDRRAVLLLQRLDRVEPLGHRFEFVRIEFDVVERARDLRGQRVRVGLQRAGALGQRGKRRAEARDRR